MASVSAGKRVARPGSLTLVARAGAHQAAAVIRYTLRTPPRQVMPIQLQMLGGAGGARWNLRLEDRIGDTVRLRLDLGHRPPPGFGRFFGGHEPRALTLTAPRWALSAGEVRYSGGQLDPSVNGYGVAGRWNAGGLLLQGAAVGGKAPGAAVELGTESGAGRLELGISSAVPAPAGERVTVLRFGAHSAVQRPISWRSDLGIVHVGGSFEAVGAVSGELVAGPLAANAAVTRAPSAGFARASMANAATAGLQFDAGGALLYARGRLTAVDGAGWVGGQAGRTARVHRDASAGIRLRRSRATVDVGLGLRSTTEALSGRDWTAGVGVVSARLRPGQSMRVDLSHDHTWALRGTDRPDESRARLQWSLPTGLLWVQGTAAGERGWQLNGGGDLQYRWFALAASGGLVAPPGQHLRASASAEASWTAGENTVFLAGIRKDGWSEAGPDLHLGIRRRVGARSRR